MTTPLQIYKTIVALRQHFTNPSYDFFKKNGAIYVNEDVFVKRVDYYLFEQFSKKPDYFNHILANILENEKIWIHTLLSPESNTIYKNWKCRTESLSYLFKEEMKNIKLIDIEDAYLTSSISFETFTICADINWNILHSSVESNPILEELVFKAKKYRPFLSYNKEKMWKLLGERYVVS
jgi:hypothetical protein